MALITCEDCSKEFSDQALACPNCGRPSPAGVLANARANDNRGAAQPKVEKKGPGCLGTGFAILFVLWGIGFISNAVSGGGTHTASNSNPGGAAPAQQKAESETVGAPQFHLKAMDLVNIFKENQIAADAKYKGKVIEVSGVADRIKTDILDSPFIVLDNGERFSFSGVHCGFDGDAKGILAKVKKGYIYKVVGKCDGDMMGDVLLRHCRFSK